MRRHSGLAWIVLLLGATAAAGQADPYEPPAANQPEHFNGAVGSYTVTAFVDRTRLPVGEPLTLVVRITGNAPSADHAPQRPDLRRMPKLDVRAGLFKIEYLKDRDPAGGHDPRLGGGLAAGTVGPLHVASVLAAAPTWEFVYRLRPLKTSVKEIPSWPFVFYRPNPRGLGSYQTVYVPRIRLEVTPRARVTARDVQGAAAPSRPAELYQLVEGSEVLRHDDLFTWPTAGVLIPLLAVCLLLPPILAVIGYRVWRRLNPDAARLARLRRSRAAERALKALRAAPLDGQARQASEVVAQYLRERLDLRAADPTPVEVAAHLKRTSISPVLAGTVVDFFRACEVVQYAPVATSVSGAANGDQGDAARELILALEAELWLASAS